MNHLQHRKTATAKSRISMLKPVVPDHSKNFSKKIGMVNPPQLMAEVRDAPAQYDYAHPQRQRDIAASLAGSGTSALLFHASHPAVYIHVEQQRVSSRAKPGV